MIRDGVTQRCNLTTDPAKCEMVSTKEKRGDLKYAQGSVLKGKLSRQSDLASPSIASMFGRDRPYLAKQAR